MPPTPHLGFDLVLAPNTGLVVQGLVAGSVADKAGIKNGDVLTHVHHTLIDPAQFGNLVNAALNERSTLNLAYTRVGAGTQKAFLDFTGGVPRQQVFNLSVFGVFAPITGGIQALDGFFMAARANNCQRFNEEVCEGFHMYDIDWSFRAYRAGLKVAVANDLFLGHASVGGYGDPKWKIAADKWLSKYGDLLAKPTRTQGQYSLLSMFFPTLDEGVQMMEELVSLTR
jgi:hypothetical protein